MTSIRFACALVALAASSQATAQMGAMSQPTAGEMARMEATYSFASRTMDMAVFEGAGRNGRLLATGSVNFAPFGTPFRALPEGDVQWQAAWERAQQVAHGHAAVEQTLGEHNGVSTLAFTESCPGRGKAGQSAAAGAEQGSAVVGAITQGQVTDFGQREVRVATRLAILPQAAQKAGKCAQQTPDIREVGFQGVLDSMPEQYFVVQRDGAIYTFYFSEPSTPPKAGLTGQESK